MHSPVRVFISGAGLGGLVLARGLLAHGFDVRVFERDPHAESRSQGYRIQLDEPGLTALARCLPATLPRQCLDTAATRPRG